MPQIKTETTITEDDGTERLISSTTVELQANGETEMPKFDSMTTGLQIPVYTTLNAPDPTAVDMSDSSFAQLIMISDGASGNPTLAYSNGAAWVRLDEGEVMGGEEELSNYYDGNSNALQSWRFNYTVAEAETNFTTVQTAFTSNGWDGVKTSQAGNTARGLIFTETDGDSNPVGVINALGTSGYPEGTPPESAGETDFYLQAGDPGVTDRNTMIPQDGWIQMVLENVQSVQRPSVYNRNGGKFVYMSSITNPGTQSHFSGDSSEVLLALSSSSYEPHYGGNATSADYFYILCSVRPNPRVTYNSATVGPSDPASKELGPNLNEPAGRISANEKVIVTIHMDWSGTRVNGGLYEQWMQREGQAPVKVSEWVGGVTTGLTWTLDDQIHEQLGVTAFRIPTTTDTDYWIRVHGFDTCASKDDLHYPITGEYTGT